MAKKKYLSSAQKQDLIQRAADWEKLMAKYKPKNVLPAPKKSIPINPRVAELREHASVDTGVTGAVTTGVKPQVYTGDKIVGIATMHKSNLVPIFNDEAAKEVAKMRR